MNCKFCNIEMPPPTYEWVDFIPPAPGNKPTEIAFAEYYCEQCPAVFDVRDDNQFLVSYAIFHKDYRIDFYTVYPSCEVLYRRELTYERILRLNHLPNITPSNIQEKLKTILTFL